MTAEPIPTGQDGGGLRWALPFAQLLAGTPRDQVRGAAALDGREDLRPILSAMLEATDESPRAVWRRMTAPRPDVAELQAAILRVDPRTATVHDEAEPRPFRLLTVDVLRSRPRLRWLVEKHLPRLALSVLFGPPGVGKSFVALNLALAIASGADFLDLLNAEAGTVVYVNAEGSAGLVQRVDAWLAAHPGANLDRIQFLDRPVNLLSPTEVAAFLDELQHLPETPVLIVFDTLARCLIGGDENSAKDMGVAIAHADVIRARTGAHVQLVHHTGKNGDDERGSSALRAAADTMLRLTGEDGVLKLECSKQKDAEPFDRWHLKLSVAGDQESCTVEVLDTAARNVGPTGRQLDILALLASHFGEDGASTSEWLKVSNHPPATFYRARAVLTDRRLATPHGRRWVLSDEGREALSDRGRTITLNSLSPDSRESNAAGENHYHSHPPLLRGDSDSSPAAGSGKPNPDRLPWQGGDDGGGAL